MRAAEWAAWTRTLPWRVAVILGIGLGGGVLGSLLAPRLGLVLGALAAVAAGWGLRFRPSPDAAAWRRGAVGERRTARLLGPLERQGWVVLHDLAVPGSGANIDHLVIGPGGVFVIDSKQYRGRLQLDPSGRLWHGRYPLTPTLQAVSFEADRAAQILTDPDVVVVPIVAVHGAQVPWGKVVTNGVPVLAARRLPSMLRQLPAVLGPERVTAVADQARIRFRAATWQQARHLGAGYSRGCMKTVGASLSALDQRRPGALLSSENDGSSVERAATLHPLWQALWSLEQRAVEGAVKGLLDRH